MKPEMRVSVLSDYICPFCYIGHKRLEALRDEFDLKIQWCFIEIHPETPALGHPIENIGHSPEHLKTLLHHLRILATEDQIPITEPRYTCNSRKALLLAEACKPLGAEIFYGLHNAIFDALFIHSSNIGDETVLRELAQQHGISDQIINTAWQGEFSHGPYDQTPKPLLPYLQYAGAIAAKSVPTFIFGKTLLTGAVSTNQLRAAARDWVAARQASEKSASLKPD